MKSFTPAKMPSGTLTPGGATFQSHNRLVVRTAYGYFYSYVYKQAGSFANTLSAGLWFSPDGNAPFTPLDSYGVFNGAPPAVLADELGDVYWLLGDDASGNLMIRKYFYSNGSAGLDRLQKIYPGTISTKWCALYHDHYPAIYVYSFSNNKFSIFNKDLTLRDSYQLTKNGTVSGVEYPFMEKDQDMLVAGWVTCPIGATSPTYDGIRYVINNLGGARANWYVPHTGASLTLPIVADATGPATDMRAGFTPTTDSVWLDAMVLTNRLNLHVSYSTPNGPAPVTQTEFCFHNMGSSYYRVSMHDNLLQGTSTSKVGGATLTIQSLRGASGFYFKGADGALYLVGPSKEIDSSGKNWINVLKSTDDGVIWQDFAQSDTTFNIYALNGMREGGDEIVGLFTNIINVGASYPQEVYSFRIPTA